MPGGVQTCYTLRLLPLLLLLLLLLPLPLPLPLPLLLLLLLLLLLGSAPSEQIDVGPLPNGHGSPRRSWAINSNTAVGCMMAALMAALIGLTPAFAGPSYGPLERQQDPWRVPQLYSQLQHVIPLLAVSPIAKRPNCTCPPSILPDQAGTASFSASLRSCRLRTPREAGPEVEGRRVLERPRPRRRLLQ